MSYRAHSTCTGRTKLARLVPLRPVAGNAGNRPVFRLQRAWRKPPVLISGCVLQNTVAALVATSVRCTCAGSRRLYDLDDGRPAPLYGYTAALDELNGVAVRVGHPGRSQAAIEKIVRRREERDSLAEQHGDGRVGVFRPQDDFD